MILFSMIGNLFRLFFGVLLLPLRLLGIPMAIIAVMVRMIMRNIFIVIIIVGTIFVYRSCTEQHSLGGSSSPGPISRPRQAKNRGNGPIIINPVTRVEDGDSAFATDLYGIMSDEERAAYSQAFFAAMTNEPDGQTNSWSSYNIAGSLRPNDSFNNNTGTRCRHFSEVLKVHEIQQTITGTACDNGNGSWCKLKPNATPACNLGQQGGGLLDSLTGSLRNLF